MDLAASSHEPVVVERNGSALAAVIPIDLFERWSANAANAQPSLLDELLAISAAVPEEEWQSSRGRGGERQSLLAWQAALMREVFVDTSFFVAILNAKDRLRPRAEQVARSLGSVRLVTTDGVLTETLNFFAEWGSVQRRAAAQAVLRARASVSTTVVPQSRDGFDRAHVRYLERLDKGYSLTDCDSMLVMESRDIQEVLTSDARFDGRDSGRSSPVRRRRRRSEDRHSPSAKGPSRTLAQLAARSS